MPQVVRPPKPPKEQRWLTINFDAKEALMAGDSLDSLVSLTCRAVPQGDDVTSEMVEPGSEGLLGNKVTLLSGHGVDDQDYEYEAIVDTALGETLTECLILEVRGRNVEPTS